MTTKVKVIGAVTIWTLALLALLGLQSSRLETAQARLETSSETIERKESELEQLADLYAVAQATIETQRRMQASRAREKQKLQSQLDALSSTASEREQTLKRLQHENEQLHDWATQPLPNWVRQFNQHPAFTSSADYRKYMQHTGAVRTEGQRPANQR